MINKPKRINAAKNKLQHKQIIHNKDFRNAMDKSLVAYFSPILLSLNSLWSFLISSMNVETSSKFRYTLAKRT